eukprot:CAMPEP_0185754034 /NCGR_PEP_ID=MMETSP1174-20130828/12692_1 /TAXON_ID=35687 /ORGANISM="Dictyocha speculum, Strain CCMP1381" /LENGTH=526 /DNA_ID=CAMNT_0028432095 /DNA_START=128 /DNA_END=1708 /DNA_ORIENTATION=-
MDPDGFPSPEATLHYFVYPISATRRILADPVVLAVQASSQVVRRCMDAFFESCALKPTTDFELAAAMSMLTAFFTLLAYYAIAGKEHRRDRTQLRLDLARVEAEMRHLQELIDADEIEGLKTGLKGREIRIFVEGAFDVMHYGHANAFRQARALGTYLIAGVNSSESVEQCKGAPPIMTDDERLAVVSACKWVDEVIPRTPYVMTPEYLDWVIKTYQIDFVVHGDDPCLDADGNDVYALVKERGMYRTVPRTEGVSTTEIVGRMLTMSRDHHMIPQGGGRSRSRSTSLTSDEMADTTTSSPEQFSTAVEKISEGVGVGAAALSPYGPYRMSRFITTSRMLRLFSFPSPKKITPGMKVVYLHGGWDMFHAGHTSILRAARELGDYVLVGVLNDGIVNHYRGGSHPVLNLNERVLGVLACKYVNDVILDPPLQITKEMIAALNISVVVTGTISEGLESLNGGEAFRIAKEMGILRVIDSASEVSIGGILSRIRANAERLEAKVSKKMVAEAEHYKEKHGLDSYDTGRA